MKKVRIVIFSIILFLCILAIGIVLYIQVTENDYKTAVDKTNKEDSITEDETLQIKNNFENIFNNERTGDYSEIEKINEQKDIVYISAQKKELIPNKYDLDVQIPQININKDEIKKCNLEIVKIFQNKAVEILSNAEEYTVYKVKFHTYINDNIISVVIKANLKEGTKPEREIIKTYNYDMQNDEILNLEDIIQNKNLNKEDIQTLITEEIKKQKDYEKSLLNLGYETYTRDINNQMYKIENTNNFILGIEGHLYLIYAYGNNNFTSETDLIII